MAGYIGSRASVVSSGAERKKTFDITGTTTVLTGLSYTPTFVHLFHNGVRLVDGTDYTATNGTSITLTTAAQSGDQVVVVSYATFQPSDTVSASAGGTFAGDVSVTGAFTSLGIDDNASATAVTIDASGNLLVGTTSTNPHLGTSEGVQVGSDRINASRSGGPVMQLNRITNDGDLVSFYKDGTTVGSIGVGGSSGGIGISGGSENDAGLFFYKGTSAIRPSKIVSGVPTPVDNYADLGVLPVRFDDVYATNGTIQTSDRNEKEAIASLTPTEMLVAARLSPSFKNFKWKDSVAEKGLEAARLHSGIIAQDVQDAFTAEGLDVSDYAMFISGTWWETQTDVPAVEAVAEAVDEGGNVVTEAVEAKEAYTRTDTYDTLEEAPVGATERTRLGVRYPELLAFVAAYNDQRFLTIEARLTALEVTP